MHFVLFQEEERPPQRMSQGSEPFLLQAMDNKFYLCCYNNRSVPNNGEWWPQRRVAYITDVEVFAPGTPKPWSSTVIWKYPKYYDLQFFTCQISEEILRNN